MNPKHEVFAREYVTDHNGAQAAVRAGYSPVRAKRTAYELMRRPDVAQLVETLDAERREKLGVDADWVVAQLRRVYEKSLAGAPKVTRDGVAIVVEGVPVMEWSPSGANKALELLAKHLGLLVERSQVEHTGAVVYTLRLDRDLEMLGSGDDT